MELLCHNSILEVWYGVKSCNFHLQEISWKHNLTSGIFKIFTVFVGIEFSYSMDSIEKADKNMSLEWTESTLFVLFVYLFVYRMKKCGRNVAIQLVIFVLASYVSKSCFHFRFKEKFTKKLAVSLACYVCLFKLCSTIVKQILLACVKRKGLFYIPSREI